MSFKNSRRRSVKTIAQSLKKHPAMVLAALAAAKVLFHAPEARAAAATDTWTGAGSTWNTAADWTGGNSPPQAGDTLVFTGLANLTANNNFTAGSNFVGIVSQRRRRGLHAHRQLDLAQLLQ